MRLHYKSGVPIAFIEFIVSYEVILTLFGSVMNSDSIAVSGCLSGFC